MFEYEFFDGDHFIIFDIIYINEDTNKITLAISDQGHITQKTFELFNDYDLDEETVKDIRYFEYGLYADPIYLHEFELL